jgi:hypothetical protein
MTFKKGEIAKGAKPFTKKDPRINKNGRPKALPDLNELLIEHLSKDDLADIIKTLKEGAKKKGGIRETELLFNRAYGLVKQQIEHSGGIILKFDSDDKSA